MKISKFETDIAGTKLMIEHGRMANQAGAAVTAQMGDTVVLATVTMSENARKGINYFPLMVDYEEQYSAAGRIKGPRYTKREGRPSNEAVLIARMIDRGLRPLFQHNIRNDIQIICTPLSLDYENQPDIVAMLAACTAVHISAIPFDGPVAGVRMGLMTGELVPNPIAENLDFCELDLVVMGDGERITMVDSWANDLPAEHLVEGCKKAMEFLGPIAEFIDEIRDEVGQEKATDEELVLSNDHSQEDKKVIERIKKEAVPRLDKCLFNTPKKSKVERRAIIDGLKEDLIEDLSEELSSPDRDAEATNAYLKDLFKGFFKEFVEEQVSKAILEKERRVDGRNLDQIRPLKSEVGLFGPVHGSGLFTRGQTQVLSLATLGAPGDELTIETMETDDSKRFFHHYNFLPYSVGEVKPIRGAGRREIGHGILAEKALRPVLPNKEDFPYTVRVVSEVMSSNGSSSMASTCGSTLALMDAGVPLRKPVAGIAIGMASNEDKWKILTDIQDLEDGNGAMDFKFTGTRDGVTAVQMDTKTRGLSMEIVEATLPRMRKALNEILDLMENTIEKPRDELSPYAPRIINLMIDPEKIGSVIGPGGKTIRGITDELDVQIDIEDSGLVQITSTEAESGEAALERVKNIVKDIEVGDVFKGAKVVKIMNFGAFINLTPGTDGLCHISEIDWSHVRKVEDYLSEGDEVDVKVIKVKGDKINVSMKALKSKPKNYKRSSRGRGRSSRGRGRGRGRSSRGRSGGKGRNKGGGSKKKSGRR